MAIRTSKIFSAMSCATENIKLVFLFRHEKSSILRMKSAATVIGMGTSLITDWVNEKKMDEKIEEKVNEALARKEHSGMRSHPFYG